MDGVLPRPSGATSTTETIGMTIYCVGDRVEKVGGDYTFVGIVV